MNPTRQQDSVSDDSQFINDSVEIFMKAAPSKQSIPVTPDSVFIGSPFSLQSLIEEESILPVLDTNTISGATDFSIPSTFPCLKNLNHDWLSLSGIYSLWDFLPEGKQLLLNTIQVPEATKRKGYLTVYEMLAIKKALCSKYVHIQCNAQMSPAATDVESPSPISQPTYHEGNEGSISAQCVSTLNHSSTSHLPTKFLDCGSNTWTHTRPPTTATTSDTLVIATPEENVSMSIQIDESLDFEQLIGSSSKMYMGTDQSRSSDSGNGSLQSNLQTNQSEEVHAMADEELDTLVQSSIPEDMNPPLSPSTEALKTEFGQDVGPNKDRISHLQVYLNENKFTYEFEMPGKICVSLTPEQMLVRRVVFIEVQILTDTRPLLLVGYRTENGLGIQSSSVIGRTSNVESFNGELANSPLHTILMRKPGTGDALRYLLNRYCPRLAQLMKMPFPILHQVPHWPLQPEPVFVSTQCSPSITESPIWDPIFEPGKRRKYQKVPARQCACKVSCRSLRCSCVRSGQPCKIKGRDCGCRSTCENPINSLVALGIDPDKIQGDRCLLLKIYSYNLMELHQRLQCCYRCPKCLYEFPMHQIVPGIRECPNTECDMKLYYSWCRGIVNSLASPAIKHCNFCHTCVNARFLHCIKCRKCVPRLPSNLQCTVCSQLLAMTNDQWSTVGLNLVSELDSETSNGITHDPLRMQLKRKLETGLT